MGHKARPRKRGVDKPFRGAFHRYLEGNPDCMDQLVSDMFKSAKRGSFAHQKELIDRSDGRVPYKMGGDEEGEPITCIVTGVPDD